MHAQATLEVHRALHDQTVVTCHVAVIAGEDHDRVVGDLEPIEGGEEPWIYRPALVDWVNAHDVPRAVHLSGWSWQGPPTTREDVCPPVPAKKEEAA